MQQSNTNPWIYLLILVQQYLIRGYIMRALRIIASIVMFLTSISFLMVFIISLNDPAVEGGGLALLLMAICIGLGIAAKPKANSKSRKQQLQDDGILAHANLTHVEGLPISEKTACTLYVKKDGLSIDGGGTEFKVLNSQLRAAEVKTEIEIANIVHSSAVKGIAGGLMFGPIGLVVGSRAMNKEKKTRNYYFIINYEKSNGELAAMMFDSGMNPLPAQKIKSKLNPVLFEQPKRTVQL